MLLKVSPCYIYDISKRTRSDWLWAPYFLNYFVSELFYRDGPFIKNVFFLLRYEENVIYSKLVNSPFKYAFYFSRNISTTQLIWISCVKSKIFAIRTNFCFNEIVLSASIQRFITTFHVYRNYPNDKVTLVSNFWSAVKQFYYGDQHLMNEIIDIISFDLTPVFKKIEGETQKWVTAKKSG